MDDNVPTRFNARHEVTTVLISKPIIVDPLPLDTTLVQLPDNDLDVHKNYRCHVCGRIVFGYYGNVRMCLPGKPPEAIKPRLIECQSRIDEIIENRRFSKKCKARYWVT